jgi:hypothetical protein
MVHSALPQLLHLLFVIHLNLSRAPFANAQAQASASDSSNSKLQSDSNSQCELLNTSLTYSQDNAPRDISGVVSCIPSSDTVTAIDIVIEIQVYIYIHHYWMMDCMVIEISLMQMLFLWMQSTFPLIKQPLVFLFIHTLPLYAIR